MSIILQRELILEENYIREINVLSNTFGSHRSYDFGVIRHTKPLPMYFTAEFSLVDQTGNLISAPVGIDTGSSRVPWVRTS